MQNKKFANKVLKKTDDKHGGVLMSYSHTNSKGQIYYLHTRGGRLFFFSKDPKDSIDLPEGMQVVENSRTGLPLVKKK